METNHRPVQFSVTVATDGDPLPFEQLSYFFIFFHGIYVFAVEELESGSRDWQEDDLGQLYEFREAVERRITETSDDYVTLTRTTRDESLDLRMINIRRRNPLDLVLLGLSMPIAACCIIAGGAFSLQSKRATLPDISRSNRRMAATLGVAPDAPMMKEKKPTDGSKP